MVEFISYSGKTDKICMGVLVLRIDGEEFSFGDEGCDYPRFWYSRGDCGQDKGKDVQWVPQRAGWAFKMNKLNGRFWSRYEEILKAMSDNIKPICYGGCRNVSGD